MILRTLRQLLFLLPLCLVTPAWGDEVEEPDLDLRTLGFETGAEQVVPTARSPRPISHIAENVTVVTAEEIALLNAHTLSDVLQTVPGVQLDTIRTPGSYTSYNLQGAGVNTVLVLIDGIRQNNFDTNYANPGLIPVQQIDRIEIIKGAASTVWGPALGGVINIVTKGPNPDRPVAGMVSGAIGSRFTTDSRGELSGTVKNLGYYLSAGNLHSDGLLHNNGGNQNNAFGKLSYVLPTNGTATFGFTYLDGGIGLDEGDTKKWGFVHDNYEAQHNNFYLAVTQPLGRKLGLELNGFVTNLNDHIKYGGVDQGIITFFNNYHLEESSRGVTTRLTWGDRQAKLVTGVEYAHDQTKYRDILSTDPPMDDRGWERWAVYLNGVYAMGPVTILPGVRYDNTGLAGEKMSYTLGATWQMAEQTVLRVYGAQGYALPTPNLIHQQSLQEVQTIQGGIETERIPYLWLKLTYFYNSLKNSKSQGTQTNTNQRLQGFEFDVRTVSLYGLSMTAGYSFLDARDADTGQRLQSDSQQDVPPHTLKLAFRYDNADLGFHARLIGNYVHWNAAPFPPARDGGIIWDLHLNWKIFPKEELSPELFFSGRNLFDGVQTADSELFTNTPCWFDGGVRFKF